MGFPLTSLLRAATSRAPKAVPHNPTPAQLRTGAGSTPHPTANLTKHEQEVERIKLMTKGSDRRNVALGVSSIAGTAAAGTATLYPVLRGTDTAIDAVNRIESAVEAVPGKIAGLTPELPHPSDITRAANNALNGAHKIGATLEGSAQMGITIGMILIAAVVAYEVYNTF